MPLNLDEARRLHDRDKLNPKYCGTCLGVDCEPHPWPCPTAVALGATGRSEWDNTPTTPDPFPEVLCTCGHARGTHKQDTYCRNCDCNSYNGYTPDR